MTNRTFKAAKSSSPMASGHRYFIRPEGGGPAVQYKSVSGFIGVLKDSYFLDKRDLRFAAYGTAIDPGISQQIASLSLDDDKQEINAIVERAARKAGKWTQANWGTAVHALTEDYDNGHLDLFTRTLPDGPAVQGLGYSAKNMLATEWPVMMKDVWAYADVVEAYEISYSMVESTVVLDELQVAGTLDRIMHVGNPRDLAYDGKPLPAGDAVGDVKTGTIDLGRREKQMQQGAYASAKLYNHDTLKRTPHTASKEYAYLIHLPARERKAWLVPISLTEGMAALKLAAAIYTDREAEKKMTWAKFGLDEWLTEKIDSTKDSAELEQLFHRTEPYWTESHVEQAQNKQERF